jgi:hypothetical protein
MAVLEGSGHGGRMPLDYVQNSTKMGVPNLFVTFVGCSFEVSNKSNVSKNRMVG